MKSLNSLNWQSGFQQLSQSFLKEAQFNTKTIKGSDNLLRAFIVFKTSKKDLTSLFKGSLTNAQLNKLINSKSPYEYFSHADENVLVIRPLYLTSKPLKAHSGLLEPSDYALSRDAMGMLINFVKTKSPTHCRVEIVNALQTQLHGVLVGLELAQYEFKKILHKKSNACKFYIFKNKGRILDSQIKNAQTVGVGTNVARHLVNLPSNWLNPQTYKGVINKLFKNLADVQVSTWSEATLEKEKMGLLLAVGASSPNKPVLVHIKYRPRGGKPPIALVGKGITFDTGGADIKSSAGMRNMKKDMGGSAAVVGAALSLCMNKSKQSFDAYLPLAENVVGSASFVPGDILQARSGKTIEIHNTDAEGRLVLADALDVAVSKSTKDKPKFVIDVATLTGAIKVGLGAEVAGLFSNDDGLSLKIQKASENTSERVWRMPLFSDYKGALHSTVADMTNCASSAFGGAITAGLFLQEFVQDVPWAHLDIYAWADTPKGALLEPGASGQMVQCLVSLLN